MQPLSRQRSGLPDPHRFARSLPLHAAWRDEGGKSEYLQDLLPVSYVHQPEPCPMQRIATAADRLLATDEPRLNLPLSNLMPRYGQLPLP